MNASKTGVFGEEKTYRYLRLRGYSILERNYRTRFGEIDMIARKGEYIVFIEVKTRSAGSIAQPLEFVDSRKQRKILLAAQEYLQRDEAAGLQPRFDVAEVFLRPGEKLRVEKINYLQNAFGG